jgi:predicted ribosome quality control (RQC) complex YloA/Tae2 family protein
MAAGNRPWGQSVPGVQSADTTSSRPLARPGQVDTQDRDLRQLKQQFEDGRRFDVVTYSGAMPRHGSLILVDATAGPVTIALAPASKQRDRTVTFKKIDATANAVTIDPDGAELIDGVATMALAAQWDTLTIASGGAQWWKL